MEIASISDTDLVKQVASGGKVSIRVKLCVDNNNVFFPMQSVKLNNASNVSSLTCMWKLVLTCGFMYYCIGQ